jgi:hypothetical protein
VTLVSFKCAQCGKKASKEAGHVSRARKKGARLFCDKKCFGLSRRIYKTKAQKVAEKAAYDAEYRTKNRALLKAKKAAYFKRTYDPIGAAIKRKERMPLHVEYCRRPEYRAWKKSYDKKYLAKKQFGPFAEAAMLVNDLNREIKQRMSNHEIKWQNETANKRQFRARQDKEAAQRSRPRQRNRRRDHSTAISL